jgi:hypothetical protein
MASPKPAVAPVTSTVRVLGSSICTMGNNLLKGRERI